MKKLMIDIETYSSVDLRESSVYCYAEAPDFEVMLFAYSVDDGPVEVIDLTLGEELPSEIILALTDPDVEKHAYNAQFERICISRMLGMPTGMYLDPAQWRCMKIHAATLGLPGSLADVGKVLGLPEDQQKMKEGKQLIQYFCKPCKPTKANGGRTRNLPTDAPDKWETFVRYNRRDVETEAAIDHIISAHPVPPEEWGAYALDQRINDNGVMIDRRIVNGAVAISDTYSEQLTAEAKAITGLENPGSVAQLKGWLGHEGSLDKKTVAGMRKEADGAVDRVLAIRQELGKSSVSKYEAMQRCACQDDRIRGLFQFYGANRTGRWAGRLVQVQNLPHDHPADIDIARELVMDRDLEGIKALYGNVSQTLSWLIRTAFVARPGYTFCVADFSAIEARVVAWLADEQWRQDLFRSGKGDIYCASASQMFHVPVVKHGINGHLRQKGKIAELALGYGGSVGALTAMGALEMGLKEEELKPLVDAWREANPNIVNLWWTVDAAAHEAISTWRTDWGYDLPHGMAMRMSRKMLHVRLPSGRELRYWRPGLEPGDYDRDNIFYYGTDTAGWSKLRSYGPKLVENIVQGTARDALRDAMLAVAERYPGIVMHVHDEMIVEVPKDEAEEALAFMLDVMKRELP